MKNQTRTVLFIALLLPVLAACNAMGQQPAATPEAAPVEELPPVVSATGVVVPLQWSQLSLSTAGVIEELPVKQNDRVESGELLLRLRGSENIWAAVEAARWQVTNAQYSLDQLYKNPELRVSQAQQTVAQARIAVRDAERTLHNLRASTPRIDIEQARANVALAKDHLDKAIDDYEPYEKKPEDNPVRAAFLSKKAQAEKDYNAAVRLLNNLTGEASELDLAEAEAELALAEAQLATALRDYETFQSGPDPEDVKLAQANLVNVEAQLAAAQAALQDLELKAPFAGTVSEVSVRINEWMSPGQPVLLLADLDNLRIETTDLNEIDVARVSVGDAVIVSFDALPGASVEGTVTRIAAKASPGSSANYTVIVELSEIPEGLLWGMTAFVDIEVE